MSIAEIVEQNKPDLFSIMEKPKFTLRPYQKEAVNAGVEYLKSKSKKNAIIILPTGSGKSIVIANILAPLEGKAIILQPSKEILEQNFAKYISNGYKASVYSASAGQKKIDRITFCTIGSIISKKHLFEGLEYIIIDECHYVNAHGGMYEEFISAFPRAKVLGLTATPYRLSSDSYGAQLKFLTRTKTKIFHSILYYVQNSELFDEGHLSKLEYYSFNVVDRSMLKVNSTGTDFTEQSLRRYYDMIDMPSIIAQYAIRLLAKRPNILIFCSLIKEAESVVKKIPGSVLLTGSTKNNERERILSQFKSGKIKCVVNVGVLTTGFDYPALEVVLIARSTMSLALYYQMVGRAMRTSKETGKKDAWIVDLGGNINFFGKVETMKIEQTPTGLYFISNNGRQLTNVPFQK
ncbi:DEAD/DEAH box helicase [Elizabethkingia sp. HX WHF]|uniref:DEAD/DEAH box helicase n=1 Tax=Elizabethkingia sp. HX WHF TaxID=3003190 RepID=UPI002A24C9DA|nr:DEAD/DEAH box helicase [Elizabethkingia sp. HX WHF]MDX8563447.1 DEAD/DEAH box helicase [Elizabethkingia sp. HX WHF]